MEKTKVLIVEDEAIVAMEVQNSLQVLGYEVTAVVNTGEKALAAIEAVRPDIVLMDIRIKGDLDGIEVAIQIRQDFGIPVIFSTAYLDTERIERAKLAMPFGYLVKPLQEKDLKVTLEMALYVAKVDKERTQAERALRESEERYRLLFERSNEALFLLDKQTGRYLDTNAAGEKLTGRSVAELTQLTNTDISNHHAIERLNRIQFLEVSEDLGEVLYIRPDGSERIALLMVVPFNETTVFGIARDITERKKTQELMIQTEKMMSVGGLAAGMAHELNNPLGGIMQGIQNIQRRLSPGMKGNVTAAGETGIDLMQLQVYMEKRSINSLLDGIRDSGMKAAHIIANMLQFSRKSGSKMAPTHLPQLIESVLEIAGKDYDLKKRYDFRNIEIIREVEQDVPLVPCTETEIEQVMLNLLKNAAQAMAEAGSKGASHQITIRLFTDDKKATIEVEDTGPGMDAETRKNIFEPFFTTKPVGEGTGLGMSVSYYIIVNNHRGTMEVKSDPGSGARFIVTLPLNRENLP